MQILDRFWKGEVAPGERRYQPKEEYSKCFRIMEQCENYLKEHLTEKEWNVFKEFTDAELEVGTLSDCDNFIEGFRMGVMFLMDVLLEPSKR